MTTRTHPHRRARTPQMEALEGRHLQAGNVTAALTKNGNLEITGDNAANRIAVVYNGGLIHVESSDGNATVVNGTVNVDPAMLTGDLKINLKGGDDTVTVNLPNLTLPNNLKIDTGSGSDLVIVTGTTARGTCESDRRRQRPRVPLLGRGRRGQPGPRDRRRERSRTPEPGPGGQYADGGHGGGGRPTGAGPRPRARMPSWTGARGARTS